MVKKLLKHEFLYYVRSLFLFEGILLCIAVLNRVLLNIESDDILFEIVSTSLMALATLGCFACFILAFVMIVVRFYKNLFSAEGYLTFTLPVTETQHLFAKLIAAFVALLSAIIVAIGYWMIILADEELFSEINFAISQFFLSVSVVEGWHIILFAVEVVLVVVLALSSSILYYYTCIALGQATKIKNRILASVGIYFLFNIAWQIVSPFLIYFLGEIFSNEAFWEWTYIHPIATGHIGLLSFLLIEALCSAGMFLLIRYIMSHKLNLE